jgi:hypothetical protein
VWPAEGFLGQQINQIQMVMELPTKYGWIYIKNKLPTVALGAGGSEGQRAASGRCALVFELTGLSCTLP